VAMSVIGGDEISVGQRGGLCQPPGLIMSSHGEGIVQAVVLSRQR
jgi:hypothetical protein